MVELDKDIRDCVDTLRHGGTILYPTDTVWGVGCDALNKVAVDRVIAVKRRPKEKSFIVLLAEARDVLEFVASPPPDIIDILENFHQPTTVIYENAIGFPENVVNADGSIAIRVTTDPFCKALIKRLRNPIISTSANISGQPTPSVFTMVDPIIRSHVDYVVHYRQDDHEPRKPSRIVKIADDGRIEVIR